MIRIHRYRDRAELGQAVATRLIDRVRQLLEVQPLAQLCLSGGETMAVVQEALAAQAPASGIDGRRLELWWSDDAYVATSERDRNAGRFLAGLAGAIHLSPSRIHAMPARVTNVDVADAARHYADELGETTFDVCLLSLGPTGSVAAIRPDSRESGSVVGVTDWHEGRPERISLTPARLSRSRDVWVMASGAAKAAWAAEAFRPGTTSPASRISGTRATEWFVDAEAAGALPRHDCGW